MRQNIFRIFHLLLIFFSATLHGQDVSQVAGSWAGFIELEDRELAINVTFSYSDDILDGTIDIPDQGVFTLPVEVMDSSENKLVFQFQTGNGPAVFRGIRNENIDTISGELDQSGEIYPFHLSRNTLTNTIFSDLPESEVLIPMPEGEISGSLILHQERSPLIILVSGSGSENRDLDISGFKVFQLLASQLYEEGYSTFRYDDRSVGSSTGKPDVTLDEMSTDLAGIISYLRSEYSERISGIVLLGHNQGGLVASMASNQVSIDGIILASTPFIEAEQVITEQIQKISEVREIPDDVVQRNLEFQAKVYNAVREGEGWIEIESELAARLEQQIKELPVEHQNALGDMTAFIQSQVDRQLETAKSRWFKSWIEKDPVEVFSDAEVPLLALFGEKDSQILLQSNKQTADSLASNSEISLRTTTIPGANHLFQEANTGIPMEYAILEHEFADGFIIQLDQFLESIQFRAPG